MKKNTLHSDILNNHFVISATKTFETSWSERWLDSIYECRRNFFIYADSILVRKETCPRAEDPAVGPAPNEQEDSSFLAAPHISTFFLGKTSIHQLNTYKWWPFFSFFKVVELKWVFRIHPTRMWASCWRHTNQIRSPFPLAVWPVWPCPSGLKKMRRVASQASTQASCLV